MVAETLLELETLDAEQIQSLINEGKLPENHHSNHVEKEEESDVKVNIHSKKDEAETETNSEPSQPDSDQDSKKIGSGF